MYQMLVLLHVGGVVVFIGSIVTALFWQRAAERSQNRPVIAHTYCVLNRLDVLLTPMAVITIAVTGVFMAKLGGLQIIGTGWIVWSLIAWAVSGVLFTTVLFPLQRRLERVANSDALWIESQGTYTYLAKRWTYWAHLTLAGIVIAFVLMIVKPQLPTP